MGLFGNLKKILFEDDDEEEVSAMPTYTKDDIVESPKRMEEEVEATPIVEEPIKTSDNSHFTNVKRDIDLNYDEKDVLGEIPGAKEVIPERRVEETPVQAPKKEEKKSVFLSFDEEEFERLNSRITKNENRVRKEVQQNHVVTPTNDARRANNNFSATSTSRDTRIDNADRYKLNSNTTKKTFTPSPIISPVYGILDKNYTKDDIVDKKGGMKREKVVKPIVKKEKEEEITIEQAEAAVIEVDIDSVRKKAYGSLSELEKNLTKNTEESVKEVVKQEEKIEVPELKKEEKAPKEETLVEKKEPVVVVEEEEYESSTPSIEDQLEETFTVEDIPTEESVKLDKVVEDVIENNTAKKENTSKSNPKMLDDLEKTSTLQILDDIEKELNSIKPISKDIGVIDEDEEEIVHNSNDTLEKDLFNLIDSMYVEGEEEEDD